MLKSVLVFGATSAVAKGLCQQLLAQHGSEFYFVARDQQKLAELSSSIDHVVGSSCFDLSDLDQQVLEDLYTQANSSFSVPLDTILIAHGDLFDQELSEANPEILINSLQLNAISPMVISSSCVHWAKQQRIPALKLAVITSVAGQRGRPRNFTYGAAKGGLSIFLQGLRSVCYQSGFEVYDFRLGPVDTPMTMSHEKNFSFSTVDKVSRVIVSRLKGRRYICYVPGFWFWVMAIVRLLPEPIFQKLKFLSGR